MKNSSAVRGMILSFAMMRRLLKQSQCTAHLNIECDDDGYTEYILEIEVGCLSDKDLKTYLESTSTNKSLSSSSKNTISEKKKKIINYLSLDSVSNRDKKCQLIRE